MKRLPRSLVLPRSAFSRLVASSVLVSFSTALLAPSLAFAQGDDPAVPDTGPSPAPARERATTQVAAPAGGGVPSGVPKVAVADVAPSAQGQEVSPHAVEMREAGEAAEGKVVSAPTNGALTPSAAEQAAQAAAGQGTPSQTLDLPSGASKTGVSSQAISVPQGSGKIEGMGESFSAQLSTGIASFGVPFKLFSARGAAEPSLSLSYSSSAGHGTAGVGWEMPVPFIARQTDRGLPKYDDRATGWHAEQDHFVFGGGQELVPICTVVSATACVGKLPDETMPSWATGWQYFRSRVEGSFQRFFWSPDFRTWRVQDKSGVMLELGAPRGGEADTSALETEPGQGTHVFRWNLTRQFDAQGTIDAPVNQVVYRYRQDGGMAFLSDIYATPPSTNAAQAPLAAYAHHARVRWADRPDPTFSFRRGYRTDTTLRLVGVDVASKNFANYGHRLLTRRYHLRYDGGYHASLLDSVQMEGRCESAVLEDDAEALPSTSCPTLPAMTFGYQHVEGYKPDGTATSERPEGYEPFDARLRTMKTSPPHSLDEELTDLFDVNSDGLPDVVSTAVGVYGGKHGLFVNGATTGVADSFASDTMCVKGVLGADAGVITLKNQNLSVQDLDGDGTIDFLHMPKVKTYSVYTPMRGLGGGGSGAGGGWCWVGREINTPKGQAPTIDFGKDADRVRVLDVNGDGLVDVMRITGTEVQTYFALGRYPGGDAVFGQASMLSASTAALSQTAVTSCVPWSGGPVQLEDKQVTLGDMNGDGLQDLVRIRKGDIQYWPGRGNGMFGTGDVASCPGGTFGQNRHIEMANAPQELSPTEDTYRLDDVNGDGLTDLLQVRFDAIDVWLNVDGNAFTPQRFILDKTPVTLPFASRFRVVDINGSGTRDLLWGNAEKFQYMDLAGAKQPWLLTSVANGLGKTTELTYQASTELMLAAAKAGKPWSRTTPNPMQVVTKKVDRDHLEVVGRPAGVYTTEYTYRDPSYDGRQREFRGFEEATVRTVGDANSPTSLVRSRFLLGTCRDDVSTDGVDACAVSERWRDNQREALKGLPATEDSFDETGKYLSTSHHQYTRRTLYEGLDGRSVQHAFESQTDNWAYDLSPFTPAASSVELADVVGDPAATVSLASTAGRVRTQSAVTVDVFGNRNTAVARGCIEGCSPVDETITTTTVASRRPDDPSGWMWRTIDSYVTGSSQTAQRKRSLVSYDLAGNPVTTSMVVYGALGLPRYRQGIWIDLGSGPTNGSVDGVVLQNTTHYDAFGSPIVTVGANNRCSEIERDPFFADLPLYERIFAGAVGPVATAAGTFSCGTTTLPYRALSYDRGFGLLTASMDLHYETTQIFYDGFGRLVRLQKPSISSPGTSHPYPAVLIDYDLPTDAEKRPYARMRTRTQDGASYGEPDYREAYAYVDGLGRTLVTLNEADKSAGDGGDWIVNGLADWDTKGAARRAYLAWYADGDPTAFPLGTTPPTAYGRQRYDAFGRAVQLFGLDGTVTLQTKYHALSTDAWDAADLSPGPHQGTYASSRKDGHGRAVETTERVHAADGSLEARHVRMGYTPSGAVSSITRVRGASYVKRWMRFDTQDRMVLNVDAHTTAYFTEAEDAHPASMNAWRYAYSDSGDLVGTSDARGCGQTFFYDAAGRMLAEDYSPCEAHHPDWTPVNLTTGDGAEVFYKYDTFDADAGLATAENPACEMENPRALGRLTSLSDRASKTWMGYDIIGRVKCIAKRLAPPGEAAPVLANRYTGRIYTQTSTFDGADRPVEVSTGVRTPALLGVGDESTVTTRYAGNGSVKAVTSSYGTLVRDIRRAADGPIESIGYGDVTDTRTDFRHDDRRRVASVQTYRGPPPGWDIGSGLGTQQLLLQDLTYAYDEVDNPTEIRDWRIASEWPTGAKPVSRTMAYDDLYRVTRVDYRHHGVLSGAADDYVDPHAADAGATVGDTRRQAPPPRQPFTKRMQQETFSYDWLGNRTHHDDDSHAYWDRSVGTYYFYDQPHLRRPYQIGSTQQAGPRWGLSEHAYDLTGNLTLLRVRRLGGTCVGGGTDCAENIYRYKWDEVGRLQEARRDDGPFYGTQVFGARLQYSYDASDDRVRKTVVDATGAALSHTLYVFESLELRGATVVDNDYERTARTEVGYLFGHGVRLARLHYEDDASVVAIAGEALHVLLELPDHLGSTSIVLDRSSGELVEAGTYVASGGTETDYRPGKWKGFREDYRFTGKEDDLAVGLTYFGKRYLVPALGTWASADPLAVHGPGQADLNLYAYVSGKLLAAVDPVGLDTDPEAGVSFPSPQVSSGTGGNTETGGVVADNQKTGTYDGPRGASPAPTTPLETRPQSGVAAGPVQGRSGIWLSPPPEGFKNFVARDFAEQGREGAAALAEAGHGCTMCHLVKDGLDKQMDPAHYDGVAVGMASARDGVVTQLALGSVGPGLAAAERGSVMLDTNALIAAVKPGGDAALAGRAPVVSITAAKEFLKGRNATVPDPNATTQVLRQFLRQNGGRMGAAGTESSAAVLRATAAGMNPARSLKLMDSRVLASAQQEGLPVMTRDTKFYNFMQALKYPSEKF